MRRVAKCFLALVLLLLFSGVRAQESRIPELDSPLHLPPEVNFGWTQACYGDTTYFFNATLRGGNYQWYVFDKLGDTLYRSTNTDISYYFPTADTFYVFLQADNGHITSLQDTLIIGNNLQACFSFMHCSNLFLNQSFCAISYNWDFGDGGTSTDSIPVHEYADTGKYNITLVAHNGLNTDTFKQQVYISVVGFANPAFTLNLSNDTLYYLINNYVPYSNIYWGFGDGGTSNSQQGYYVYAASGSYSIYLNQTNGCGIIMHDTTLQVSVLAGIQTTLKQNSFSVYPNPSSNGIFNVKSDPSLYRLTVANLHGQVIVDQSEDVVKQIHSLDLSDCPAGQYLVRAVYEGKVEILKIVRE